MNAQRIQKAEQLIAEGEKHLKTTLFKWSPDVESAVESFDKAAIQFKNASDFTNAVKVLLRVARLNENKGSHFHAGKALDSCSACCRESNDLDGVLAYADQAADLFQKASSADTAFNTLTRAAKHAEGTRPEASIQFYTKAADLYKMEGGRIREAADVLGRAACLQIRQGKMGECLTTVERERDLRVESGSMEAAARTNCCLVLVHLKMGNFALAQNEHSSAYKVIKGYDDTDAAAVVEELLSVVGSNSLEDFAQMVKNPYFRGLENDYVKMLRNMEMPEGAEKDIDFNAAPSAAQTMPDFNDPASTDFNEPEPDFC